MNFHVRCGNTVAKTGNPADFSMLKMYPSDFQTPKIEVHYFVSSVCGKICLPKNLHVKSGNTVAKTGNHADFSTLKMLPLDSSCPKIIVHHFLGLYVM